MSVTLQSISVDGERDNTIADYTITHALRGTTLTLNMRITQSTQFGTVTSEITDLRPKVDGNVEEAVDKLAEWLERAAIAIRNRGPVGESLPVRYVAQ